MKSNLASEKKSIAAEAAVATEDPTREIMERFKGIQGNIVGALNKEMKFEQLIENEEFEK